MRNRAGLAAIPAVTTSTPPPPPARSPFTARHDATLAELDSLIPGYAAVHPAGLPAEAKARIRNRQVTLAQHAPVDDVDDWPICEASGDMWPCLAYRTAAAGLLNWPGDQQ